MTGSMEKLRKVPEGDGSSTHLVTTLP